MTPSDEAVLVLTTVGSEAAARELSHTLVEENLAACVTRSSIRSVYRWEENSDRPVRAMNVCEDEEVLLVIKTAASRAEALESRLAALHPYTVPEVVRIRPQHVDPKYLAWLLAACAE